MSKQLLQIQTNVRSQIGINFLLIVIHMAISDKDFLIGEVVNNHLQIA